eukprot:735768-Amphidinium_carterae.1
MDSGLHAMSRHGKIVAPAATMKRGAELHHADVDPACSDVLEVVFQSKMERDATKFSNHAP